MAYPINRDKYILSDGYRGPYRSKEGLPYITTPTTSNTLTSSTVENPTRIIKTKRELPRVIKPVVYKDIDCTVSKEKFKTLERKDIMNTWKTLKEKYENTLYIS